MMWAIIALAVVNVSTLAFYSNKYIRMMELIEKFVNKEAEAWKVQSESNKNQIEINRQVMRALVELSKKRMKQ